MKEDKYIPIIILLIFAIGIAFMLGNYLGWQDGFDTAKAISMNN